MGVGSFLTSDAAIETVVGLHQILPSQYFDTRGGHHMTGEQRLMLALLADAINVYQQGVLSRSTRKRLLYVDAERWIVGGGLSQPFSFDNVCDALSINPSLLRRKMIDWKHRVHRESANPPALSNSTRHLRLKITPRPKGISRRRSRARLTARAF
jgi:hypothetical protein